MHRILGGDPEGKIHKLMDYTDRGGDVVDQWYSGKFDVAYMIYTTDVRDCLKN